MDVNTFLSAYPSYKRKHRQHIVNVQVKLPRSAGYDPSSSVAVVLGMFMFDGQSRWIDLFGQITRNEWDHHAWLSSLDLALTLDLVALVHFDQRFELSSTAQRNNFGQTQTPKRIQFDQRDEHYSDNKAIQ